MQLALDPSPGRLEPPPAPDGTPAAPARNAIELLPADAGQRQLWALLTAAGAVSVLAFAWQRVRARS